MPRRARLLFLLVLTLPLFLDDLLEGCGKYFPNSFLRDDPSVTAVPEFSFEDEIERILADRAGSRPARPVGWPWSKNTDETDIEEIAAALSKGGLEEKEIATIVADVATLRKRWRATKKPASKPKAIEIPEQIPEQYRLYLRGARAFHRGEHDQAISTWRQLLELPEEERQQRTTWAIYMLAVVQEDTDSERSKAALPTGPCCGFGGLRRLPRSRRRGGRPRGAVAPRRAKLRRGDPPLRRAPSVRRAVGA